MTEAVTTDTRAARLWRWLQAPQDAAGLAAFRVALGLIVAISSTRFLAYGWVDRYFAGTKFQFKYWGFGWVPSLPGPWIHAVFAALIVIGLLVAAGLFYRVAIVLLFLLFSYVQLYDVSNYLNHYYLVSLLAALLSFIPAHRCFSLDALRRPELRSDTLPAWCTYLIRFQVAVVYVNAGLAKLTSDWLLHAQPLQIWLAAHTDWPLVGPWLDRTWVAYFAAWGGFLFDTFIVAFLLARRTRPFAYLVVLGFHATTSALFPIGMFPVIMVSAALIFFDPSWPRRWLRLWPAGPHVPSAPASSSPSRLAKAALAAAAIYGAFQVAWPLRTHLYGGNVLWHEQGMRFSWRVMAREKNGSVTFVVRDPTTSAQWHVSPRRYLNGLQEREMAGQPDLILQLAHHIAREHEARLGHRVEVYADARAAWNGRPSALLVDPTVNLARETDGLAPKRWIAPAPATPPLRMRPLVAHAR